MQILVYRNQHSTKQLNTCRKKTKKNPGMPQDIKIGRQQNKTLRTGRNGRKPALKECDKTFQNFWEMLHCDGSRLFMYRTRQNKLLQHNIWQTCIALFCITLHQARLSHNSHKTLAALLHLSINPSPSWELMQERSWSALKFILYMVINVQ